MKRILVNIGSMFGVCFIFSLTNNLLQNNFKLNQVSVLWSLGFSLVPLAVVLLIASIISAVVWLFKKKLWGGVIPFMWLAVIFVEITTIYGFIPKEKKQGRLSQFVHPGEAISPAVREYQDGNSSIDSLTSIKNLHSLLLNGWSGFTVSFEEFAIQMQDEAKLKKLHSNLRKKWSWFTIPYSRFSSEIKKSIVKTGIHNNEFDISNSTRAIEINPMDESAYLQRGKAKLNLADWMGAVQDFTKIIEINPNNAEAYKNRGETKYYLSDYRGSIADYSILIKLEPLNAEAFFWRGLAKQSLNDNRGAVSDFTQAIKFNPKYALAYTFRGYSKINLGMMESGCLDFSKAGELGDGSAYHAIEEFCN